jgi:hypothetical protein
VDYSSPNSPALSLMNENGPPKKKPNRLYEWIRCRFLASQFPSMPKSMPPHNVLVRKYRQLHIARCYYHLFLAFPIFVEMVPISTHLSQFSLANHILVNLPPEVLSVFCFESSPLQRFLAILDNVSRAISICLLPPLLSLLSPR